VGGFQGHRRSRRPQERHSLTTQSEIGQHGEGHRTRREVRKQGQGTGTDPSLSPRLASVGLRVPREVGNSCHRPHVSCGFGNGFCAGHSLNPLELLGRMAAHVFMEGAAFEFAEIANIVGRQPGQPDPLAPVGLRVPREVWTYSWQLMSPLEGVGLPMCQQKGQLVRTPASRCSAGTSLASPTCENACFSLFSRNEFGFAKRRVELVPAQHPFVAVLPGKSGQ